MDAQRPGGLTARAGRGGFFGFGGKGEGAAGEAAKFLRAAQRLLQIVERAALHRLDGGGDRPKGGDEHKGRGGPTLAEKLLNLETVAIRHAEVGDDQGEAAAGAGGARFRDAGRGFDQIAFALKKEWWKPVGESPGRLPRRGWEPCLAGPAASLVFLGCRFCTDVSFPGGAAACGQGVGRSGLHGGDKKIKA